MLDELDKERLRKLKKFNKKHKLVAIILFLLFIIVGGDYAIESRYRSINKDVVGEYNVVITNNLIKTYPNFNNWNQVFIEFFGDGTFLMTKIPALKTSIEKPNGDWYYEDTRRCETEMVFLDFNKGGDEQMTLYQDTLEIGYPYPEDGEEQIKLLSFYKVH